uniref:Uncharacterized protein n=1 Tax=Anopheles stephensi TaxID=30069 RepID=A0A182YTC8_ANOST
MPSKDEMLCALENAKVEVPNTATIPQIRRLFDETCLIMSNEESALQQEEDAGSVRGMENKGTTLKMAASKDDGNVAMSANAHPIHGINIERSTNACLNMCVTIVYAEGLMDKFSGDNGEDINAWIDQLEHTFQMLQMNEIQQLIITRRLLEGTAAMLVKSSTLTGYIEVKK